MNWSPSWPIRKTPVTPPSTLKATCWASDTIHSVTASIRCCPTSRIKPRSAPESIPAERKIPTGTSASM